MRIMKANRGFTAIELIIVMLCLSILTISVIVKNPFSIQDYSGIAADQLIADVRYIQLKAITSKRPQNIIFTLNTASYDLREGTTVIEAKTLPKNVIIRTASFSGSNVLTFNTLGEPTYSASANGTITLGDGSATYKTITVYPITGKVQ